MLTAANTATRYRVAFNQKIISLPGRKPDMGTGLPPDALSKEQRRTRRSLTYENRTALITLDDFADLFARGYSVMNPHSGGASCRHYYKAKPKENKLGGLCDCMNRFTGRPNLSHRSDANFEQCSFVQVDLDHLTSDEEVRTNPFIQRYGTVIAHSASSMIPNKATGEKRPKMKAFVFFDEPATDPVYARLAARAIFWKVGVAGVEADAACKDLVRLSFGRKAAGQADPLRPVVRPKHTMSAAELDQLIEEYKRVNPQTARRAEARAKSTGNSQGQGQFITPENFKECNRSTREGLRELKRQGELLAAINTAGKYYMPLNNAAFFLGQLIGWQKLTSGDARKELEAATANWPLGAGGPNKWATIETGLSDGLADAMAHPPEMKLPELPDPLEGLPIARRTATRYLPPLKLSTRVTGIRAAMGSGKTQEIKRQIDEVLADGGKVLVITHRISLAENLAERLGLENYRVLAGKGDAIKQLTNSQALVICVNSLWKIDTSKLKEIDLLIFDESEQLLKYLTSNLLKSQRQQIMARLEYIIRRAKQVICADAHLSKLTYSFFERLLGSEAVEVVVNDPMPNGKTLIAHDLRTGIIAELQKQLGAGKRCFVAINSCQGSNVLFKAMQSVYPHLKFWLINSETVASQEEHEALKLMDDKLDQFDCIIASPSVGSGVSLEKSHIDTVFLIGESGQTTHLDLLQQTGRVRQPASAEIHSWISSQRRRLPTDPEKVKADELRNQKETAFHIKLDLDTGQVNAQPEEQLYLDLWSQVRADRNASWGDLRGNFYAEGQAEGYTIKQFGAEDLEAQQVIRKELSEAKLELEAERAEALMVAPDITAEKARALEMKPYLSLPDRQALERYKIKHFYDRELTVKLVKDDDRGRTRAKVINFACFTDTTLAEDRDRAAFEAPGLMLPDVQKLSLKTWTRRKVLEKAGLLDHLEGEIEGQLLKERGFDTWLKANKSKIERRLEMSINPDNPVQVIASILGQLGLKLVSRQYRTGKKKIGEDGKARDERATAYRLEKTQALLMRELSQGFYQAIERKKREQAEAQAELDRLSA
jgi:hypothetical protein